MSVPGISQVAAYLPPGRSDGVPRAGWDEDGFTLAVAAVERLGPRESASGVPGRILLVGSFPPTAEANLARYFASALPIDRVGAGRSGTNAAIRAAQSGPANGGPILVLAVDLAADDPGATASAGRAGPDRAVAVWFDPTSAIDVPPSVDTAETPGATAPFFEYHAAHGRDHPEAWLGTWEIPPSVSAAAAGAARPRPAIPLGGPVSQGAYVPMPRYEENLPSRWRLAADRCPACGALTFPVRGRCRVCGRTEGLTRTFLPLDGGLVVATTTIGPGGQPTEFDDQVAVGGPYEVALIELVPEVRVTLQVTDATPGSLKIGDRAHTALRRLYPMEGEWRYGRKATRAGSP